MLDGRILEEVRVGINFGIDFDGMEEVQICIDGKIMGGWYSFTYKLSELSRVFGEDDLVRVKFALAKMNGMIRVK